LLKNGQRSENTVKAPDRRRTTTELCVDGFCAWRLPG
jgi:hypothetical protein